MDWFAKKILRNNDNIVILSCMLVLFMLGTTVINSATQTTVANNLHYTRMNIIWFSIGMVGLITAANIDIKKIYGLSYILYGGSIVVLLIVRIAGTAVYGSKSWLEIGGFSFQPSEIAKLCLIVSLSAILSEKMNEINKPKVLLQTLIFAFLPIAMVALQPDFGTAMVMTVIVVGMFMISKLNTKYIIGGLSACLAMLPIVWFSLKSYQKNRILVFIDPNLDPLGAGYNVIQSKIAIGSGKIFGKGLFNGTQNNLNFVPKTVKHSDFIFSIIGEELGFIGSLIIITLFIILISAIIKVALKSREDRYILTVMGIAFMFMFHIVENIGMTVGILPVTGIPLPFISFGGTALVTNMAAIGVILNISATNSSQGFSYKTKNIRN